jgi:hypothetical protein
MTLKKLLLLTYANHVSTLKFYIRNMTINTDGAMKLWCKYKLFIIFNNTHVSIGPIL